MGSGLTDEQQFLIVGTLLGDGCIEKRWRNPRLRIDHAVAQKDYVFWKYGILKGLTNQAPHELHDRDNRTGEVFARWYFATRALPQLEFYFQLFYKNGRKVIREELIDHFSHPLSFATLLMDDGYKRNDCDALRLSTDCFSYEEHLVLQYCLLKNFNVRSTIHKKGKAWNMYIPQTQMEKVRMLLAGHIISSMSYKLPPRNDLIATASAIG